MLIQLTATSDLFKYDLPKQNNPKRKIESDTPTWTNITTTVSTATITEAGDKHTYTHARKARNKFDESQQNPMPRVG